jgi:predicted ATPase/DNA-binding winged helix-turn-helix (wHTH) protein
VSDDTPLFFGHFEIRPRERQLLVRGRVATLGARAFDLLLALASRPGSLVTKNDLLDLVWPNLVVEENNLQVQISALRKLLGPEVVATIPGRGYRFTAAATPAGAAESTTRAAEPPPPPSLADPVPAAAAHGPAPGSAAPAALLQRTNLPARLPALIGRDDDLLALEALLQQHALVTVVGTGGIGKTLLAQHLLHRQRDRHTHGVCFVELAGITDPGQVVGAVSAAIGVQAGGGDSALGVLVQAVASLRLLIALDNAEHLIDEVARVAAALHAGAPHATVLVTSQAPLQLGPEHVYRVGTLALPDDGAAVGSEAALGFGAVALFTERVRQADRRFTLDAGNVATVVALCRRLDGLPLAISLAAARVPLLGVEGLAAALGERLKLLTGGGRDASARHRTLRAALEWSHGLLDERERVLFRRLGVVVGSASLELVRHIAVDEQLDEWSALDALSVLVDRSLVAIEGGASDATPRYRLLESPRAFALECLDAAGESELLRGRHARAMAERLARAYGEFLEGPIGVDDWLRGLEPDLDNARAAFSWSLARDPVTAVTLAPTLSILLKTDGPAQLALLDAVQVLLDERVPAALRARVWCEGAFRLPLLRAIEWATHGLALFRATGEARGRYLSLAALAWSNGMSGRGDAAAAAVAEMESAYVPPAASDAAKRGAQARAALAVARGRWEEALQHFRHCAEIWQAAGGHDDAPLHNVIEAELLAGHVDDAIRDGERLVARLSGSRETRRLSWLQRILLAAWLENDGVVQARRYAAQVWPQVQIDTGEAALADLSALLAALEGRPRNAVRLVGYADATYAALRDSRQVTEARSVDRALALARAALGEAEVERLRAAGAALDIDAAARETLAERDLAG